VRVLGGRVTGREAELYAWHESTPRSNEVVARRSEHGIAASPSTAARRDAWRLVALDVPMDGSANASGRPSCFRRGDRFCT